MAVSEESIEKEIAVNCPNCGREIADAELVCEHCGIELNESSPQPNTKTAKRFNRWMAAVLVILIVGIGVQILILKSFATPDETGTRILTEAEIDRTVAERPTATVSPTPELKSSDMNMLSLLDSIQPPAGYAVPASLGNIGPQLLDVGAIDLDRFVQLYEQAGQPLSDAEIAILTEGTDATVTITRDNSYFLLNFFWALGLANQNPLLDEGPMMQYGEEGVGGFASTGGWTLGTRPATEFYSSAPIITLTTKQQARVEEVAKAVYRPCCGNPTSFPDCNHGMAMLGLLELMASQGATEDEMFEAAKYVNAFWFPQQMLEVAVYFEAAQGVSFADLDGRLASGPDTFSGRGFGYVHQWLAENGLLEQLPGAGGSCGV